MRHPDHALNESIRKQVETLHTGAGIYPTDKMIDHLAPAVALEARTQGLTHVDQLRFNADKSVIVVAHADRGTFGGHGTVNVQQAMQVPPEQSYQRMADVTHERAITQAAIQQHVAQPRQSPSLTR
ncbi:MAG: XVIPCD domain-containing protein [Janthinobacterium lividum]